MDFQVDKPFYEIMLPLGQTRDFTPAGSALTIKWIMRKFQIAVFALATLALIVAACCLGKQIGTEFRNAGIAALLFDVVCIQLWPPAKRHQT